MGFDVSYPIVSCRLNAERVRFPSPAPLLYPSDWTVYRCDKAVGIMILTTDSMSFSEIWRSNSVLLYELMDLLLLPLSKMVRLIGLLRSKHSSSFFYVDVALTLFLYNAQFEDLSRKNRLANFFGWLSLYTVFAASVVMVANFFQFLRSVLYWI